VIVSWLTFAGSRACDADWDRIAVYGMVTGITAPAEKLIEYIEEDGAGSCFVFAAVVEDCQELAGMAGIARDGFPTKFEAVSETAAG